jgi:hypothetical protein
MSVITGILINMLQAFAGIAFCVKSSIPDQVRWLPFILLFITLLHRFFVEMFIQDNRHLLITSTFLIPLLSQKPQHHDTTC